MDDVIRTGKKKIVTFGGAWSNHIIAVAAICREYGIASTGIIRGEKPEKLSRTLEQAEEMGMQLVFISREDYRQKIIPPSIGDDHYIINEGGFGSLGAAGAASIFEYFDRNNYTHIACAAGTGTMAAGLAMGAGTDQTIIAISVLKGHTELENDIQLLSENATTHTRVLHEYNFGGYAKWDRSLINFMNELYRQTSIPTDFVYTGKLFYAITDLVAVKFFPPASRILLIHSGGLQGNISMDNGTLIF